MSEPMRVDPKQDHLPGSVGEELEQVRKKRREKGGGMGRGEVPRDGSTQGNYERPEAPPSGTPDKTATEAESERET
ncbi:MAG TPA: hypothetical protein VM328_13325 [Fimbriimonadaceae bacterium]|nr:hypothetical protein [Fimbriimonadaceae bacterium]